MSLPVSIVVPAHNAATTLAETVASVQAQSHRDWELIVVENGSTDDTVAIAAGLAASDDRIRVVVSKPNGVSTARNRGLELARHGWVLFLDADDWLLPGHLEALTSSLVEQPTLDAVHCGWRRVCPDGRVMFEEFGPDEVDLFPHLARTCAFAIHACIVRRSLILEVGGFDPALRTCEDWDLWQRLARAGARFGMRHELLAAYRARPNSASMDGAQMLADGFKVIARAFAPDPRVPRPLPAYAAGLTPERLPGFRLDNLVWQAGLLIGAGREAVSLLNAVAADPIADLDAKAATSSLFEAMLLPTARTPDTWHQLYADVAPLLGDFLDGIERHTRQAGLARCMMVNLERHAVAPASIPRPLTVGRFHSITVDVTSPFPDLSLSAQVERLHCRVEAEGDFIGELELPVCDGTVPADILADAVAAEFAWPILGRFFARTLYPELGFTGSEQREEQLSWNATHDRFGWPLFVQQAWGLNTPPGDAFYALQRAERRPATNDSSRIDAEWLFVDLLDEVQDHRLAGPHVDLVLTVAGVPVSRSSLIVPKRLLLAHTIRAAVTAESSFELCRACVREGLLHRPFAGHGSLRDRLSATRARRLTEARTAAVGEAGFTAAANSVHARHARANSSVLFWPRHAHAPCGTSASRRALLPQSAAAEVRRLASLNGESLVPFPSSIQSDRTVVYSPELMRRPSTRNRGPNLGGGDGDPAYFEALFSSKVDPWNYTSAYEQTKYRQTLDLLPSRTFERGLELACAEGHFTQQLAPRVRQLLATDVSEVALDRTRERCAGLPHVECQRLDIVYDPLPREQFDLIVCSEVLYYTGSRAALEVAADRIVAALEPGGCLVCAHAHLTVDNPRQPGFDWDLPFGAETIGAVLNATPGLHLVREIRTPLYRVQLYRRLRPWRAWIARTRPEVRCIAQPTPLPEHVARHARWQPRPLPREPVKVTERLPILMYHRIAADGPAALARYRLSPERFEAQLQYLRDNDYESVTLEEWRAAGEVKRPLPGLRVLLTFDDGCVDFMDTAWPLLKRYGFGALVFLPTDEVGGSCRWDARYGEPAPLMNWADLRALSRDGVEFGSHTATHPMLTGLSLEEVAREALRSRADLEERLGAPVTSVAYPYGATDRAVEAIFGASGYLFGVTCDHRCCEPQDRLLALPRLEVSGLAKADRFADLLSS